MSRLSVFLPVALAALGPTSLQAKSKALSGMGEIRLRSLEGEQQDCEDKTGAVRDPGGNRFIGSAATMAAFRACLGKPLDPGASDSVKSACAEKTGAHDDHTAHRYVGPLAVIGAWQDCAGISRDAGATDAVAAFCARQSGARFDFAAHRYRGPAAAMDRFLRCVGRRP